MAFFGRRGDQPETQVSLREMPDGRLRYYAFATNNYVDRGGLVFPQEEQQRYAAWVRSTGRYPELWVWHARGSRLGQADKLWFDDHFQFTSGLIDQGKEEKALRVIGKRDIAMSHGYVGRHVELPDGTIEVRDFLQFEQSVLPRKAAANYGTYFGLAGSTREGQTVKFTDEQREWFRSIGESDERISEMERMTSEMQDFFSRRHIDFRSVELAEGDPGNVVPGDGSAAGGGVVGQPGGGVTATTAGQNAATAAATTLTEEDVRRIVGETVEPLLAEVRQIGTGIRSLQQSDDERVASHWESAAARLPKGFRASQEGPAPTAGVRAGAPAAVGAPGAVNAEWLDEIFGKHPLLGGGNGAGGGQ
jgi:hypothetical protein